jgi:hypothetical protein
MSVDGHPRPALTPRRVFGLSVLLDLLVRFGGWVLDALVRFGGRMLDVLVQFGGGGLRWVDTIPGTPAEPLLPAVSLLGGVTGGVTLTQLTGLSVVALGIYLYGPKLFTPLDASLAAARGFRLILTVWALAFLGIARTATLSPAAVGAVAGLWGALVATLVWYGRRFRGWQFFDADGHPARFLDSFLPTDLRPELREDFRRDGLVGLFARGSWLVAFSVPFAFAAFVFALAGYVLLLSFPVADVLALASLLLGYLSRRGVLGDRPVLASLADRDLEARVYELVELVSGSLDGATLGLAVVAGLLFSLVPGVAGGRILVDSVGLTQQAVVLAVQSLPDEPIAAVGALLIAWQLLGAGVLYVTASGYGMWFWLRELERVFVSLREDTGSLAPARPRWSMWPPVVLTTLGLPLTTLSPPIRAITAVLWPLLAAAALRLLYRTRGEQSPVIDERPAVLVAFTLSMTPLLLVGIRGDVSEATGSVRLLTVVAEHLGEQPRAMFLLCCLAALVYYPSVIEYAEARGGRASYVTAVFVAVLGITLTATMAALGGAVVLQWFGIYLLVMAVVLGVVKRVER